MAETTNYQCPNCNGRLFYNGELGQLQCEFCESTFSTQEIEQLYAEKQAAADAKEAGDRAGATGDVFSKLTPDQVETVNMAYENAIAQGRTPEEAAEDAKRVATGLVDPESLVASASAAAASMTDRTHVEVSHSTAEDPVQAYLENSRWDANADNMRAYNCPSCGAQLMVDQVTAVTSCPYCGNNTVVPGQLSDVLKPDYVIPFKLDKQAAVAALKSYYEDKKLLPNSFTEGNHIEEVQGVYVPFWLYSGTATGDVTLNGRNIRTWSDSKNMYTETDHYLLYRTGSMDFARVPVDGSTKMPDAHMDAIEPFDYSEMVPFSIAYMPGYLAERYDLDVKECDSRARNRVENTCVAEIESTASGYMETDVASSSAEVEWTNIAYALLPVWMLHTKWNGEDYLFAMNGQTGKLIGDLPIDKGKMVRRFLFMFVPLLVIIFLIVFFVFGF